MIYDIVNVSCYLNVILEKSVFEFFWDADVDFIDMYDYNDHYLFNVPPLYQFCTRNQCTFSIQTFHWFDRDI